MKKIFYSSVFGFLLISISVLTFKISVAKDDMTEHSANTVKSTPVPTLTPAPKTTLPIQHEQSSNTESSILDLSSESDDLGQIETTPKITPTINFTPAPTLHPNPTKTPIPTSKFTPEPAFKPTPVVTSIPAVQENSKFSLSFPHECIDLKIFNKERCKLYLQRKYVRRECFIEGITTVEQCERFLFKKHVLKWCTDNDIGTVNETECRRAAFIRYGDRIKCVDDDTSKCDKAITEKHLGDIVAAENLNTNLKIVVSKTQNKTVSIKEIKSYGTGVGKAIPIADTSTTVRFVRAKEEIILDKAGNILRVAPMVLFIDSDRDGLPDNMELRLGTDPLNADTNKDGVMDDVEIRKSVNLSPIDKAILQNKELEHPKTRGELSRILVLNKVENSLKEGKQGYVFSGKAEPNTVITLYVYSDLPLIVTVKTDEFGNWKYEMNEPLSEGEHEVYVVINDNTGKVKTKSNPFSFFVKEARALSLNDFLAEAEQSTTKKESETAISLYIIVSLFAVFAGIILFVAAIVLYKKQKAPIDYNGS